MIILFLLFILSIIKTNYIEVKLYLLSTTCSGNFLSTYVYYPVLECFNSTSSQSYSITKGTGLTYNLNIFTAQKCGGTKIGDLDMIVDGSCKVDGTMNSYMATLMGHPTTIPDGFLGTGIFEETSCNYTNFIMGSLSKSSSCSGSTCLKTSTYTHQTFFCPGEAFGGPGGTPTPNSTGVIKITLGLLFMILIVSMF